MKITGKALAVLLLLSSENISGSAALKIQNSEATVLWQVENKAKESISKKADAKIESTKINEKQQSLVQNSKKKTEKKKHHHKKHHKHHDSSDESDSDDSDEDDSKVQTESDNANATSKLDQAIAKAADKKKSKEEVEAAEILKKTSDGIKTLDDENASLSDIKSLMQQVKNQKTNNELEEDEKALILKKKHEKELFEQAKAEQLAELNKKSEAELEEEAEQKKEIEKAQRKENAEMYKKIMEEDDTRDGVDSGGSNFQVIVDQQAEQNYAINTFTGSGNMSEIFDAKPKDEEAEKKEIESKFKALQQKKAKKEAIATADKGEAIMNSDDPTAMYEFSNSIAAAGQ